jgi:GR25 family glycosyltransferase involved in LPS biosynthesis
MSVRMLIAAIALGVYGLIRALWSMPSRSPLTVVRVIVDIRASPAPPLHFPHGIVSAHVINLEAFSMRWADMVKNAEAVPLSVERFPAVDTRGVSAKAAAELLPVSQIVIEREFNRSQPGAIGCFASHRNLIRHLLEEHRNHDNNSAHLILEDDAVFSGDYTAGWLEVWREIENLQGEWDMVMLGLRGRSLKPLPNHTLLKVIDGPAQNYGTHAYVVRHGSLPVVFHVAAVMHRPIDSQFVRAGMEGRLKWFGLGEDLVRQGTKMGLLESTIRKSETRLKGQ